MTDSLFLRCGLLLWKFLIISEKFHLFSILLSSSRLDVMYFTSQEVYHPYTVICLWIRTWFFTSRDLYRFLLPFIFSIAYQVSFLFLLFNTPNIIYVFILHTVVGVYLLFLFDLDMTTVRVWYKLPYDTIQLLYLLYLHNNFYSLILFILFKNMYLYIRKILYN